jgi:hypothetical protein
MVLCIAEFDVFKVYLMVLCIAEFESHFPFSLSYLIVPHGCAALIPVPQCLEVTTKYPVPDFHVFLFNF